MIQRSIVIVFQKIPGRHSSTGENVSNLAGTDLLPVQTTVELQVGSFGKFTRGRSTQRGHLDQLAEPIGHNRPVNRVLTKVQSTLNECAWKSRTFLSRKGR